MASCNCTAAMHWGRHANIHWIPHQPWETGMTQDETFWRFAFSSNPVAEDLVFIFFFSPHKHWSDFSHIVASHCWVVESGTVFILTGKRLGKALHWHTWLWKSHLVQSCLHGTFPTQWTANADQGHWAARPQTISDTSLCSFTIAFHLWSQIPATGLHAGRYSTRECCSCHCFNSFTAFSHSLVVRPSLLQKVHVTLKICSALLITAGLGPKIRSYLQN